MDGLSEILIAGLAFLGLIFILAFILAGGFSGNIVTAEKFCESHGLELDYFEGPLTKIVCRKASQNNPNQTVFDFESFSGGK